MLSTGCRASFGTALALLFALLWSLPASATVTCFVRRHGAYVCTFYCQNGQVCDNDNLQCVAGPEMLQELSQSQESARQATLVSNRSTLNSAHDANGQATGYDGTYYNWNGDPREIPSPRYRSGGGFSSTPAATTRRAPGNNKHQIIVPAQKQSQLLALLAAARSFAANDPSRAGAEKMLRKFVRDNKIPADVDALLDCEKPKTAAAGKLKSHQLQWRVPDILPEVRKRGLCAQAKNEDEKNACEAYQFGQVVMSVEPEIKALCKLQENDFQEKDPEALGLCAENKFRNAWAQRDGIVPEQTGGTTTAAGQKCPDIAADNIESLRDRLRRLLAGGNPDLPDDSADASPPADAGAPAQAQPKQTGAAADQKSDDDDDPFCAFIARKAVRGELTVGAGDKIPDNCRKAVDAAKPCTDQKCSMADIIEEQEHKKAAEAHPWGVDDYHAVDALTK
jgi:hypothetical protein